MVKQYVAEDFAKDVINNIDDCEGPEWTIFSEPVKEKGSAQCGVTTGSNFHAETGDLSGDGIQQYGPTVGNSQEKEDAHEVSRSGNNRKHKKMMLLSKSQREKQRET